MSQLNRLGIDRAGLVALARRPALWPTAAVLARRFCPNDWWRHWPPLPLPSVGYLRFRLQTMYGDDGSHLAAGDFIQWLEWCRRERSAKSASRDH